MKSVVLMSLLMMSASATAGVIRYDFNTQTFSDAHRIGGYFVYNDSSNALLDLLVAMDGPTYSFNAGIADLSNTDSFSFTTDNLIFGDNPDEGFQVTVGEVNILTGQFGYGSNDTCYYDNDNLFCTGGLFQLTATVLDESTPAVSTTGSFGLLLAGLGAMVGLRRRRK